MPISHAAMAKQNIDAINAGLLQHDCPWPCGKSWYTRLSPEEKERALRERGMAWQVLSQRYGIASVQRAW